MAWANPTSPNLADYTLFLQGIGFTAVYLPPTSLFIGYAFNRAMDLVIPFGQACSPVEYTYAVYNLAAHFQIKMTPDQPGQIFFSNLRGDGPSGLGLNSFVGGIVSGASDVSTGDTLTVPDFVKTLTIRDLDLIRTPYGREYLMYAQDLGPIWGLS